MPTYEYRCQKCRKRFSLTLTITQHDKRKVKCPSCQSANVEQQIQAFYATTSRKS